MHAMQRVAHRTVLEAVALNDIEQRTALSMRHILQRHRFLTVRHMLVYALEHRHKSVNEVLTSTEYRLAMTRHLLLPNVEQCGVGLLLHLQQSVALL